MRVSIIIFCTIFISIFSSAQEQYDFDYKIDSEAFETERKFYVHVHEGYYNNDIDSFGVIYVLDAQASSFYNNAKSIIDYLDWGYQISPMIVVGIHSENRHKEFIPLDRSMAKDSSDNIGQAEKLRDHIEKEIFPVISENYKVNEFRALIGHSRAGAFIANTLFSDKKDMFNAYISISPGMHYLNNQILNDVEHMISSNAVFNKFYFCSHGTVGPLEAYFKPQVNYIDSLFAAHPNKTIDWYKAELKDKTHWTVVAPSIVEGVLEMNRSYQVDQVLIDEFASNEDKTIREQVDAYYKMQNEKLGFTIPPMAYQYRFYANDYSELGNYKRAIELYDLSIELNKNDIRSYHGRAWAYRQLQDNSNAIKTYHEALEVLELNEMNIKADELDKKISNIKQQIKDIETNKK